MQRLRLTSKVTIEGKNWIGDSSRLILEPTYPDSDLWYSGSGVRIPITLQMFAVQKGLATSRCVTLERVREFHEFEHIAWLHALGLRGINVYLDNSDWPPYMCQAELWEKIQPYLVPNGVLEPAPLVVNRGIPVESRDDGVWWRRAMYMPSSNGLQIQAHVAYKNLRKDGFHTFALSGETSSLPKADIQTLVNARSLGRPQWLRPIVALLGRQHAEKIVWMPSRDTRDREHEALCEELAAHQILDTLGVISFAAPEGHFISGDVTLDGCNHRLALKLANMIWAHIGQNQHAFV